MVDGALVVARCGITDWIRPRAGHETWKRFFLITPQHPEPRNQLKADSLKNNLGMLNLFESQSIFSSNFFDGVHPFSLSSWRVPTIWLSVGCNLQVQWLIMLGQRLECFSWSALLRFCWFRVWLRRDWQLLTRSWLPGTAGAGDGECWGRGTVKLTQSPRLQIRHWILDFWLTKSDCRNCEIDIETKISDAPRIFLELTTALETN